MMGLILKSAGAAALLVAAMGVSVGPAAAGGCEASATTTFGAPGGPSYSIEAFTHGPTCDQSVAVIVGRDGDGNSVLLEVFTAGFVASLAGQPDAAGMQTALKDWIDQSNSSFKTAADLPDWPEGTDSPMSGEFPFYVEDGLDRETYLGIRAAGNPVFCFVQGMESMACYELIEGGFSKIGVQSFPG